MHILDKIVTTRKIRIEEKGFTGGYAVPEKRKVPLIPFIKNSFIITEIKRKSPSRGLIRKIKDPLVQANIYLSGGSRHLSILTEEDHFAGSLEDLIRVKQKFPHAAVLRKDFLLEVEDIDVSWRAGADAVLLIAAILTAQKLKELYELTISKGMVPLVEVHSPEDVQKAAPLKPILTGINCRDLKTFTTDLLHPLKIRKLINWETTLVFESGIHSEEEARFAFSSGFNAILTGESVVRNPSLIAHFLKAAESSQKSNFFNKLIKRNNSGIPFIKICGITNREDAEEAIKQGADIIGFILAPSPREVTPDQVESLANLPILKAGVVVNLHLDLQMQKEIRTLYQHQAIDIIQYHGDEPPEFCSAFGIPYYKALRVKSVLELKKSDEYRSPRRLLDAFSPEARGGTGKQIDSNLLKKVDFPLWLAGGITPANVEDIINKWHPELIDISSGLEKKPGIKDHQLIKLFMRQVKMTRQKIGMSFKSDAETTASEQEGISNE